MDSIVAKDIIFLIMGGVIGFIASLTTWWITFKSIVPKVVFAEKISKQKTGANPSGFLYRIRFQNIGKRDIIDISIYCIIRIRGLNKNNRNLKQVVKVPVGINNHITISHFKKKGVGMGFKQNQIRVFDCERFLNPIYGDEINEKVLDKSLTLEDILNLGDYAELQFIILGTDRYSGARKYIESHKYYFNDIVEGYYEKDKLSIIETVIQDSEESIS